jgi:hypothetical protein
MELSDTQNPRTLKTLKGTLETLICAYMVILISRHFWTKVSVSKW